MEEEKKNTIKFYTNLLRTRLRAKDIEIKHLTTSMDRDCWIGIDLREQTTVPREAIHEVFSDIEKLARKDRLRLSFYLR